jgi:hypothetical protein
VTQLIFFAKVVIISARIAIPLQLILAKLAILSPMILIKLMLHLAKHAKVFFLFIYKIVDFVDVTKFSDFSVKVPPAHTYRVTIDFWAFVHDTTNLLNSSFKSSVSSIIMKDFFSISLMQDTTTSTLLIYCVPLESFYTLGTINTKVNFLSLFLTQAGIQTLSNSVPTASSKWVYTRCAYSYKHGKMYMNSDTVSTGVQNLVPVQYVGNYSGVITFMQKYFRVGETTNLNFQGFYNLQTQVYVRNFRVFSEYLDPTISLKYINIHKVTDLKEYPQLLYSLPLDDLVMNGSNLTGQTTLYDFSYQSGSYVKTSSITLTYNSLGFKPPKNFRRIKFLAPTNGKYGNTDLKTPLTALTCTALKCFDDSKAFTCNVNNLLNISTLACAAACPANYMRLPQNKNYVSSEMCNYNCPTGTSTCPTGLTITTFACTPATYYTVYYQCLAITPATTYINRKTFFKNSFNAFFWNI